MSAALEFFLRFDSFGISADFGIFARIYIAGPETNISIMFIIDTGQTDEKTY